MARKRKSGFQVGKVKVNIQEPPVQNMTTPDIVQDRRFWPTGAPMPTHYSRRQMPCVRCKRVLMDDGGQAVVMRWTKNNIAGFRCKACDKQWQLPIR